MTTGFSPSKKVVSLVALAPCVQLKIGCASQAVAFVALIT